MVEGLKEDVTADMPRHKIVLRRHVAPQWVRSFSAFSARSERVSRWNLPQNVTVRRTRRLQPRKKLQNTKKWTILGAIARLWTKALTSTGLLKKGLIAGAKAINSHIGKKLIDRAIKHLPELHQLGTSKIKKRRQKSTGIWSSLLRCSRSTK